MDSREYLSRRMTNMDRQRERDSHGYLRCYNVLMKRAMVINDCIYFCVFTKSDTSVIYFWNKNKAFRCLVGSLVKWLSFYVISTFDGYLYKFLFIYIYIYIYIERERERERKRGNPSRRDHFEKKSRQYIFDSNESSSGLRGIILVKLNKWWMFKNRKMQNLSKINVSRLSWPFNQ